MSIISKLVTRARQRKAEKKKESSSNAKALGPVFVKQSEKKAAPVIAKQSGSNVKVVGGTASNPKIVSTVRSSSGGGSSSASNPSPSSVSPKLKETNQKAKEIKVNTVPQKAQQKIINNAKQIRREAIKKRKISQRKQQFKTFSEKVFPRIQLQKEQSELNKDIELFNKKYAGRELRESEIKKAQAESRVLNKKQEEIKKKEKKLDERKIEKIKNFFKGVGESDPNDPTGSTRVINTEVDPKKFSQKQLKSEINFRQKALEKEEKNIQKLKSKSKLNAFQRKELKIQQEKARQNRKEIKSLKEGNKFIDETKLVALTFPIEVFSGAGKASKVSKIRFAGKQKLDSKNRLITDLVFVSGRGEKIGVARAVTVQRGKEGYSVVGGRLGSPAIAPKGPKGGVKVKVSKKETFLGVEKTKGKAKDFKIQRRVQLLKNKKKSILKIRKNVEGLEQISLGKVAVRKGTKIATSKKPKRIKKRLKRDEFASISAIITKKDLSRIIGKTITIQGDKAQFIGIIKGEKSASKFLKGASKKQKQQYKKALEQVIGSVSSAVAKAEKSGLSKNLKLAKASSIISSSKTRSVAAKIKPTTKTKSKKIQKIKNEIKQNLKNAQKNLVKLREANRSKLDSKSKAIIKQKIKQAQKQQQKLKQAQKIIQKQTQKSKLKVPSAKFPKVKAIIRPLKVDKKKKIKRKVKPSSKVQGYDVFGKSKGKFIKLNKKPLSLKGAKDRLAYAADQTTSKTVKYVPKGKFKKPELGKIMAKEKGYYSQSKFKLREFKIKSKKKIKTPKTFIEKRKFGIDTKGEKRGLSLAKYKKQITRSPGKKKRNLTPSQRKQNLKNLEKARKVRMQRLKKRR